MKTTAKTIFSTILVFALIFSFIAPALASAEESFTLGNSDLNIQNGGIMLTSGDTFYFSLEGGIFAEEDGSVRPLCAGDAKNLNQYKGYIFFTVSNAVYKVPEEGGDAELVFTAQNPIKQMYLRSGDLLFISGGKVYELLKGQAEAFELGAPENTLGLIPTQYGNLYLTGSPFDFTVFAEATEVLHKVSSCYTDSGYLAIAIDNQNYQLELSALFKGFEQNTDLQPFSLHGTVQLMELLGPDDENAVSEDNENTALTQDFAGILREAGLKEAEATLMTSDYNMGDIDPAASQEPLIPPVSQGQVNIVKRARQLHEIKWTPLEDRYQWGYKGVFKAETTYTGIPYGQPVNTNGYIGYGVSLQSFAEAMLDNTSRFYTGYSTYNKISPTFSTDCSGFVSYAWNISQRKTTYSLPQVAERVGNQSIYALQVGDCLNKSISHVVLVAELAYDAEGKVTSVTIMEQTPVITKLTKYGEGSNRSLASLQSYYLDGGYVIYRHPERDSVFYTPNPAVPLDNEVPDGMKNAAPKTKTTSFVGGKTVSLSSENGSVIYYTLDGSTPTAKSSKYTGELSFTTTSKLRAIAPIGEYDDSAVLNYSVKVPQSDTPKATISSGLSINNLVESGAKVSLTAGGGATIYYTLDGSTPDSSDNKYLSPITINRDTTIKVIAEKSGESPSETLIVSYKVGQVYTITASAGTGGSISPAGESRILENGSRNYTIAPKTGYEIKDVLVDGVSVGPKAEYEFNCVAANHKIEALFVINTEIPFTDVPKDAWYREAVAYAHSASLFYGTSQTTFSPEQTMSRGMFVTVLGRNAGVSIQPGATLGLVTGAGVNIRQGPSTDTERVGFVEKKNTPVVMLGKEGDWYKISYDSVEGYIRNDLMKSYNGSFSDVPLDIYYSPYAQWAYLVGITSGTSASTFSPDAEITREQMCTLLNKYATVYGVDLPSKTPGGTFPDDGLISAFACDSVYKLRDAGIINGMGDGTFAPQGSASRGQVAHVFMKFINTLS